MVLLDGMLGGVPPQANCGIAGYTNSGYGYGTNEFGHNYAGGLSTGPYRG